MLLESLVRRLLPRFALLTEVLLSHLRLALHRRVTPSVTGVSVQGVTSLYREWRLSLQVVHLVVLVLTRGPTVLPR